MADVNYCGCQEPVVRGTDSGPFCGVCGWAVRPAVAEIAVPARVVRLEVWSIGRLALDGTPLGVNTVRGRWVQRSGNVVMIPGDWGLEVFGALANSLGVDIELLGV